MSPITPEVSAVCSTAAELLEFCGCENAGPDFGPGIGCATSLSITSGRYVFLSRGFSLGN